MPEPTRVEVLQQAMVPERAPTTPTPASERAARIRERATEVNWRQGLEEARESSPLQPGKVSQKTEQIGVERDPSTGVKVRTSEEQARFSDVNKAAELGRKVLEKGVASLTNSEKTLLSTQIIEAARKIPFIKDQIDGMNLTQVREYVERQLSDPQYKGELKRVFENLLDPENKFLDDASINEASDSVQEQEYQRDAITEDIKTTDERLANIDAKLKEFAPAAAAGGTAGTKFAEIERIKSSLATIQAELKTHQTEADDAEFRLGQLNQERQASLRPGTGARPIADIDADIVTERAKLKAAQAQIQTREVDIAKLPALEKEEKDLQAEKAAAEKEKRDQTLELNKTTLELQKRQRVLQDRKAVRAGQEQDFVEGMKNAFGTALSNTLSEQIDQLNSFFEQDAAELADKTQDQDEQAMYSEIARLGLGAERTRGIFNKQTYRPLNKAALRNYRDVLFGSGMAPGTGGPIELLTRRFMDTINPRTNAAYTRAEAEAIVARPGFVEKFQPQLIKKVAARGLMAGVFSAEDFHYMEGTQWGQGMVQQAIEKNAEFKSELEKVMGPEGLAKAGFASRWAEISKKKPWLLLLLLGIPAAMLAKSAISVE